MKDDAVHEKFCYQDVAANCGIYGGLYQWNELTPDWQGICPDGWHVPDTTDFMVLLRKAQTEHPMEDNAALRDVSYGTPQSPGLDSYGFAMLGSGRSSYGGPGQTTYAGGLGNTGYLWTSTTTPTKKAQLLTFWPDLGYFSYYFSGGLTPDFGMAVRCIRD